MLLDTILKRLLRNGIDNYDVFNYLGRNSVIHISEDKRIDGFVYMLLSFVDDKVELDVSLSFLDRNVEGQGGHVEICFYVGLDYETFLDYVGEGWFLGQL